MRRFLSADWHLGKATCSEDEMFDVLYFMLNTAVEEQCDTFEILGDLSESRTLLMFRLWPRVKKFFDDAVSTGMEVRLLSGNHDHYSTLERTESNLRHVSLNKEVRIIDEIIQDDDGVLYAPWLFPDETLPIDNDTKVILGHLAVNGFYMGVKKMEENGLDIDKFQQIPVYLGHFHTPQVTGNIRYLGNIIHSTWTDEGQPKYAYILDDDFNIEKVIELNDNFTNLVKVDYDELKDFKPPLKYKITVLNVPKGDDALVIQSQTKQGATSVECLHADDNFEIEDIDKQTAQGLSVDEAIEEQIDEHDMKDELKAFHSILEEQK